MTLLPRFLSRRSNTPAGAEPRSTAPPVVQRPVAGLAAGAAGGRELMRIAREEALTRPRTVHDSQYIAERLTGGDVRAARAFRTDRALAEAVTARRVAEVEHERRLVEVGSATRRMAGTVASSVGVGRAVIEQERWVADGRLETAAVALAAADGHLEEQERRVIGALIAAAEAGLGECLHYLPWLNAALVDLRRAPLVWPEGLSAEDIVRQAVQPFRIDTEEQ
jgi:hypothetical protein